MRRDRIERLETEDNPDGQLSGAEAGKVNRDEKAVSLVFYRGELNSESFK